MTNLSKFAETLDELIFEQNTKAKLDAKTLAENLGVRGSTITRYLREERVPTLKNLVLLADYFNCTTDYLLGRENENFYHAFKRCPPFHEQFCFILEYYSYSPFQFSKEAKIHQSRVYAWKTGKRIPSLDNIIKIADFFQCSVDFVIGREK